MKVAITARGPGPEYQVDESFGRAYWMVLHDLATGSWESIDNQEIRNVSHGAGEKASRMLHECGVRCLLTGETGPRAFRTLSSLGIEVYHGAAGSVAEALNTWREGGLTKGESANSKGSPFCLVSRPEEWVQGRPRVELSLIKTY